MGFITPKVLAGVFTAGYVLTLIPLLLIARYNFPSADDYSFGDTCRYAWRTTHSIWQVLKEAFLLSAVKKMVFCLRYFICFAMVIHLIICPMATVLFASTRIPITCSILFVKSLPHPVNLHAMLITVLQWQMASIPVSHLPSHFECL